MVRLLLCCLLLLLPAVVRAESKEASPCDQHAARLLQLYGLDQQHHWILCENLAAYLANLRQPVPEAAWADRATWERWLTSEHPPDREQERWYDKLNRDLREPYDDVQVGQRVELVSRGLRELIEELEREQMGRRYVLYGGIAHGRFGANSDLDFQFSDKEELKPTRTLHREAVTGYGRGPIEFDRTLEQAQGGHRGFLLLPATQPWEAVGDSVRRFFTHQGLTIDDNGDGWVVQRAFYPDRSPEIPARR